MYFYGEKAFKGLQKNSGGTDELKLSTKILHNIKVLVFC